MYKQLTEGKDFTSQGEEDISKSQIVRCGYDNIIATGLSARDCAKWYKTKPADQTWPKFQDFFTIAVKEYAKYATTADKHTAANVQEIVNKHLQEYTLDQSPPQDENANTNLPPPQHHQNASAVTMESMQATFKAFMDTTKK